jgi:hypothetical protein
VIKDIDFKVVEYKKIYVRTQKCKKYKVKPYGGIRKIKGLGCDKVLVA